MARTRNFKQPKTPMNQWAQDAFNYAEDNGKPLTYDEVAEFMTKKKIGGVYDKSKIQKMTTERRISLLEADALSEITGYPIPRDGTTFDARVRQLSRDRQKLIEMVLSDLEAAEASDRREKE